MKLTKNLKALIIAVVLTGLLIGAYQGAKVYQAVQAKKAVDSGPPARDYLTLVSFDREDLAAVDYPDQGMRLIKKDGLWETEPVFPGVLNTREIDNMVWYFANMSVDRIVEENPADLAIYGLDTPRRTIITLKDGKSFTLLGGDDSPSGAGTYVMVEGDPKVYLVPTYIASMMSLDTSRIRLKELTGDYQEADITRLVMETEKFRIEMSPRPEGDFTLPFFSSYIMTSPYVQSRGVMSEEFATLAGAFKNLQIQSFVESQPASLGSYGLDKPTGIFIETKDGPQVDLLFGKKTEGGLRYVQRRGENEVFTVYDPVDLQAITPFSLAEKFALILNIADVNTLTVRGPGTTLTAEIRRTGEGDDKVETYFLNGKQAEEKSFKAWYQAVIGLIVDAEHPNRPQRGGGEAEVAVDFLMDKPAGERAGIRLIPYNRDFYALDAGGVVEFLVSRVQVRALFDTAEKVVYLQ